MMGSTDRTALIVHPGFDLWAGGEMIALHVCKALLEDGYDVTVASEAENMDNAETLYGRKDVLSGINWIALPRPRWNRLKSLQRLINADELTGKKPDIVFETQKSSYVMPDRRTISIVYHPGDLLYYWGNGWLNKRELYYRFIRGVRGMV